VAFMVALRWTAVKVALRKSIASRPYGIGWALGLKAQNLLDFSYRWLATKL
jgi:hypothetical protein